MLLAAEFSVGVCVACARDAHLCARNQQSSIPRTKPISEGLLQWTGHSCVRHARCVRGFVASVYRIAASGTARVFMNRMSA